MKLLLIGIMLAVVSSLMAQATVKTIPLWHEGKMIFGTVNEYTDNQAYGLVGDNGDGADTSIAFSSKQWSGASVLFMLSDTTSATAVSGTPSDSCLTVILQLKENLLGVWGMLYSETTATYTKLDTVSRLVVNVGGTNMYYMTLADETSWAAADSARFIFQIAVGDSLYLKAVVGGQ
jgi:hypothetical protein